MLDNGETWLTWEFRKWWIFQFPRPLESHLWPLPCLAFYWDLCRIIISSSSMLSQKNLLSKALFSLNTLQKIALSMKRSVLGPTSPSTCLLCLSSHFYMLTLSNFSKTVQKYKTGLLKETKTQRRWHSIHIISYIQEEGDVAFIFQ